ncbi:division/cell wall cluster transcriptional repressor MraZ [Psychrobium sp. 1_MG-2023]|uniref:division/cell wall cluster transcriptional repressor MraZ n=1 Tax=Psychrobium sp. 1_MG-2023 TaxID=3062624 RepID=UPI000C321763|nr:division/cell wall cluster transcriptional repressor MraZ [Psychrobium sp. 1_MG-2023]MDP2561453.1 division/cell wall cluster transcriptional repressor MraZ [Psychrobium sp. 1_MG-2023]PKF57720.1 cell division/cell wall cluster transcriptional repressor MraZ [Alteromonadales bacterium alter-6D02]
MLRGTAAINLDAKGRFTMPTGYRDLVTVEGESKLVVTIDISRSCLMLYPLEQWQVIERKLMGLSDFDAGEAAIKRLILGNANDCDMDKNGRVLLPAPLRQHAGLEKKLMLIGHVNKFELWDESQWLAQREADLALARATDFSSSTRLKELAL